MSFQVWLAFVAATLLVLVTPGPTVLLVLTYGMRHGIKAVFPAVIGVGLGHLTAIAFSTLLITALLAMSAELLTVLQFAGSLYLIWLGVAIWRTRKIADLDHTGGQRHGAIVIRHLWMVTAFNPNSLTFFIAFLPQFLDQGRNVPAQFAVLIATFILLSALNTSAYSIIAARAHWLVRSPGPLSRFHRAGGAILIFAGMLMLVTAAVTS